MMISQAPTPTMKKKSTIETRSSPVAPRIRIRKTMPQATSVATGTTQVSSPDPPIPTALRNSERDLPKKISSSEFQPMIDRYCRATVMTHPLRPNWGTAAWIESIPKRVEDGTTARVTSSMPIMAPAVMARAPGHNGR
jgi:hypothetical protein